ncbi:unnamed protein product [Schistosoma curassoni]|uniref:Transposase n=1 Tax=Schistosoma curassoni TaxID=6186 RepID=A0A183JRK2_9TREM|nr:unnamed protein product [Schistosoma curassoni]
MMLYSGHEEENARHTQEVAHETPIHGRANQMRFRDFKGTAPTSVLNANVRSVYREFCTKRDSRAAITN